MRIRTDDIRDFFRSYALMRSVLKDREDEYASRFESATKVTTAVTGMPRGGGSDRHELLCSMADSNDDRKFWERKVVERGDDLQRFIHISPLPMFRKRLLGLRYLAGMTWPAIKEQCDGMFGEVSLRQIYREHNKAFDELADWAPSSEEARALLNGYIRHE